MKEGRGEGVDNTELMTNEMEKRQQLSSEGKETCHFVDANVPAIQIISTGWHCVGVRGMRGICIWMRVCFVFFLRIDLQKVTKLGLNEAARGQSDSQP